MFFGFSEQDIFTFFSAYAYSPGIVYIGIFIFMLFSGFGLPVPEEVVLVSSGLVAYTTLHPDLYPPPVGHTGGHVNIYVLAVVCFLSVLMCDFIVFLIGKYYGVKIVKSKFFKRFFPDHVFVKIQNMFLKYSTFASGIFRVTPGIRFPGHITCGMMGISPLKFLLIDGIVALITVPTQVLLVGFYGQVILTKIKEFKIYLMIGLAICAVIYLLMKYLKKNKKVEA